MWDLPLLRITIYTTGLCLTSVVSPTLSTATVMGFVVAGKILLELDNNVDNYASVKNNNTIERP